MPYEEEGRGGGNDQERQAAKPVRVVAAATSFSSAFPFPSSSGCGAWLRAIEHSASECVSGGGHMADA
jgi:hypothetical protein